MRSIRPPELAIGAGALVLLAASAVGALGAADADEGGSAPVAAGEVAIVDFAFSPEVVETSVGQGVSWTNEDSAAHTVTSDGDGPMGSGDLAGGESYEVAFDAAGTYEYICTIHPTMRGTVEVSS